MKLHASQKARGSKRHPAELVSSSRRTFLKILGGALVFFSGLGGMAKKLKAGTLLRPPGGQNEEDFIAQCLKCDRCRSACPTSVIGLADLSDSVLDARTPVMKFHLGYCDFCNRCVEVCPTQALRPFDQNTVKIGLATIRKDICIAWNSSGCTVCEEECSYQAISLDEEKRPVVDPVKCNGCGICENVCPALALKSYIGGKVRGIEVVPLSGEGGKSLESSN